MKLSYLTLELVIGFFFLFILIKVLGKKIINQATPFTFIAAIVLGELLGNALYDDKVGVQYVIYAMCLWGGLLFGVEILGQRFLKMRGFFEGKPAVLIRNGIVNRDQLKKSRMNLNQLQSLLRQSETFSMREVAYCYLEANGSLSILKQSAYQKTTQEDFNLPRTSVHVPVTIIRDGEVLQDELNDLGRDEQWIKYELKKQGITEYKHVFIAEWLEGDGLFVQTFDCTI
ncbi:DUF421 domain-containing protein [Bacillus cereus]|uniref:DUF421 domain-containing protein n=1 Tax=Bacillus cereus TaxID=1396 RepID=UPI002A553940|nr:DUF421 domain-containing protein [Bacillus pseudomycoides]